MEQKSMTALVSAYARFFHAQSALVPVFSDSLAGALLTEEEKTTIAASMAQGIKFFAPEFEGGSDAALEWVVNNYLAPSPLGRAAFAEAALEAEVKRGAEQYIIMAAGYDTFAHRRPEWAGALRVFELDHPATAEDKRLRVEKAVLGASKGNYYISADFTQNGWERALLDCRDYKSAERSFCSLLGILYYLPKSAFAAMLKAFENLLASGSVIAFDCPDGCYFTPEAGERAKKQTMLAGGAGEKMLAGYSQAELSELLQDHGFAMRELLTPTEITGRFFSAHNAAEPQKPITAFDNVYYCLAEKI